MAAVQFKIYKRSEDKKASIIAVLRVSQSIRPEIATGEHVFPRHWGSGRVKGGPDKVEINLHLNQIETALLQMWRENRTADKTTITDLARGVIKGEAPAEKEDPSQKKTSLFTVGRFLAQCKRELGPKTVGRYRVVWRVLSRFQKGKRLDFAAFDMSFHDRFKNFLYDTPNPNYTGQHLEYNYKEDVFVVTPGIIEGVYIGLLDETVFKYLVIIKTMCDWAAERNYKVNLSYKTWPIIKRDYPPITWKLDELEAIENLPALGKMVKTIPHHDRPATKVTIDLDFVRDYISFAARTGPRISDVKRFNQDDIKGNTWTITQKKGNRTKTKVVTIPLTGFASQAKLILEKYNYQFPSISEVNLNIGIKEVCRRAGITQPFYIERWAGNKKIRIPGERCEFFSTHTCKKSFITLLASEGVPIAIISRLTGTSQRTIEKHYLGDIDTDKLADYMEKAGVNKSIMRIAN